MAARPVSAMRSWTASPRFQVILLSAGAKVSGPSVSMNKELIDCLRHISTKRLFVPRNISTLMYTCLYTIFCLCLKCSYIILPFLIFNENENMLWMCVLKKFRPPPHTAPHPPHTAPHPTIRSDSEQCETNYNRFRPLGGVGVPFVAFYDRWAWPCICSALLHLHGTQNEIIVTYGQNDQVVKESIRFPHTDEMRWDMSNKYKS